MRQPDESASSARRTPSTPTAPDSVGRPPRRATRNSLSQRFSRLEMTVFAVRADLPGEGMKARVAENRKGICTETTEDAECTEKRSGGHNAELLRGERACDSVRAGCSGAGRVAAASRARHGDSGTSANQSRKTRAGFAAVCGGKADARVRGGDSDRHAVWTGGGSV